MNPSTTTPTQFFDRHADPDADPDAEQKRWLPIAELVLANKFGAMDAAMRESIAIGLRSIKHPTCEKALLRLGVEPKPVKKTKRYRIWHLSSACVRRMDLRG